MNSVICWLLYCGSEMAIYFVSLYFLIAFSVWWDGGDHVPVWTPGSTWTKSIKGSMVQGKFTLIFFSLNAKQKENSYICYKFATFWPQASAVCKVGRRDLLLIMESAIPRECWVIILFLCWKVNAMEQNFPGWPSWILTVHASFNRCLLEDESSVPRT